MINKDYNEFKYNYEPLAQAFINRLYSRDMKSIHKLKMSSYYFDLLKMHIFLKHSVLDKVVILEEGIIHNNSGLLDIADLTKLNDILPDLVIALNLNEEDYIQRRLKRPRKIFYNEGLSDIELINIYKDNLAKNIVKQKYLKEQSLKLISIDASVDPNKNAEILLKALINIHSN